MKRRTTFAVVVLQLVAQVALAAVAPRIVIIKSSSIGPFNEAVEALVESLRQSLRQPEILTLDLDGDPRRAGAIVAEANRSAPQLIVTVGSLATAAVLREAPTAPVVFSMVLYPLQSGFLKPADHATGASLDVPLQIQFAYMRRLFPSARRIGVLYHPAETGSIIEEARKVAAASGVELIAEPVSAAAHAVAAMEALMDTVDIVWSVADEHVFSPQSTSALILATLRHHTPLFGLSVAHVRAGAIAALSCDYADIGRQTAEISLRVLEREKLDGIPVSAPRTIGLALNLRSAQRLGVDIPESLQAEAREIIR